MPCIIDLDNLTNITSVLTPADAQDAKIAKKKLGYIVNTNCLSLFRALRKPVSWFNRFVGLFWGRQLVY